MRTSVKREAAIFSGKTKEEAIGTTDKRDNALAYIKKLARKRRIRKLRTISNYRYKDHAHESHNEPVFCVSFNNWLATTIVFATVGSNQSNVYECLQSGRLKRVICYCSSDPDEKFFSCSWSYDAKTLTPQLAIAGYRGIIYILDVSRHTSLATAISYCGHGQSINDIKYHPHQPHLLLTCSKDHSIRLWNTFSHVCVALFGGVDGHRDEVLSIDFDIMGTRFISSSMDHSVKLWYINTPAIEEKIKQSWTFSVERAGRQFPTHMQHFPDFTTRNIHRNYIDCVRFFGELVLTKSCNNSIRCWKPGHLRHSFDKSTLNDSLTILANFTYRNCTNWFVRFGFNHRRKILSVGSRSGELYIWELNSISPEAGHSSVLVNRRNRSPVRQVAFSPDASILVYVCEDGTVWRFNRLKHAIWQQ